MYKATEPESSKKERDGDGEINQDDLRVPGSGPGSDDNSIDAMSPTANQR